MLDLHMSLTRRIASRGIADHRAAPSNQVNDIMNMKLVRMLCVVGPYNAAHFLILTVAEETLNNDGVRRLGWR